MMLKWLIAAVIIYGGFVALLYLAQRSLQYFPERRRTAPSVVGLTKAEEVVLDTADRERVIVWHVPPCDGQPVFLYFHGNGGSLRWREDRFRDLIADGSGLVALSYRGYGGSTGNPTEKGLIEDAEAAYAFSVAHYTAERLVLWGESLGSALALTLAAENPVGCVVLEAPITSAVDVGAQHYWFVPVRLLMKDQFRSDLCAGKVTAPVLVVHGEGGEKIHRREMSDTVINSSTTCPRRSDDHKSYTTIRNPSKEILLKCYELQGPSGIDGLTLVDKPAPQPGEGQVLVRLKSATLNYRDLLIIKGGYGSRQKFPLVPLSDGAGLIEAVGSGVQEFAVGDRVIGSFFENWVDGEPSDPGSGLPVAPELATVLSRASG